MKVNAVACFAGVFHGFAGPGGVLGVLISLKINQREKSIAYLGIFFLVSIVVMAFFAFVYCYFTNVIGKSCGNVNKCQFHLKIASSAFSIVVGILWLVLSFTDSMHLIFGD